MIRRIITIDEAKCNGCGLCAKACHEGAIGIVNNKAKLLREDYCDGLGDCLPACPMNAITFIEREAPAYNEVAVIAAKKMQQQSACPGTVCSSADKDTTANETCNTPSGLCNWPVQIKLAPVNAPYFDGADLLIAADCTAYAYGAFHRKFMQDKITLIACPKLDSIDYSQKLAQIIANNDIKSITITRMTVPCCGGLPFAVKQALERTGKDIPVSVAIISPDGQLVG